jgi:hypothetical protein
MKNHKPLLSLFIFLILAGCSPKPANITTSGNPGMKGQYDSRFPDHDASDALETVTRSVCKIYSVATYKTYYFKERVYATHADIASGNFQSKSFGSTVTSETTSGTGTVILHAFGKIALISCAHVVESPDTLINFFRPLQDEPTQFISSIAVKQKQENFVRGIASCGPIDVLAIDKNNDIAILGKPCETSAVTAPAFAFPVGNSKELRWGSFVYIIGYPLGSLMITKGIVSLPRNDTSGSFLVDALFNKGFSGGILLAVRNGVPNFELVGIIRSVPSQKEFFVKPEKGPNEISYDEKEQYKGELYVGTYEAISYGVTMIVPVEKLVELYQRNRAGMLSSGYDLDGFFHGRAGEKN